MVTKAVERAQGTVEDRNFEIRKNVLKYDEVMNEQRKVIYQRRQQILDGEDLREPTLEAIESRDRPPRRPVLRRRVRRGVGRRGARSTRRRPTSRRASTKEQLDELASRRRGRGAARRRRARAVRRQGSSQSATSTLRDIERRVMLSVIDQHWREHLYEMDYLQEGINLRAMGQQDPLAEWQREGFDMFEAMMGQIEDDFVRYVFHLQVVVDEQPAAPAPQRAVQRAEDPVQGSSAMRGAAVRGRPEMIGEAPPTRGGPVGGADAVGAGRVAGAGPGREDARPQRAVLLRQRQEVQALPRSLTPHAIVTMRDFSEDLADLRAPRRATRRLPADRRRARAARRARGRSRATPISGTTRTRRARSRPSCQRVRDDVELVDDLEQRGLRPARRCPSSRAKKATTRSKPRSPTASPRLRSRARPARAARAVQRRARRARRDLRSALRRGRHRRAGLGRRCCCACSRAGRRRSGFDVEVDEVSRRPRGRHHVGDVHRQGPLRVRHARGRARRAPADPHLAVRRQRAPPDRVRVVRLRARARGRPRSPRSIRPTCASTPTARRARAAST